eukprot:217351_1
MAIEILKSFQNVLNHSTYNSLETAMNNMLIINLYAFKDLDSWKDMTENFVLAHALYDHFHKYTYVFFNAINNEMKETESQSIKQETKESEDLLEAQISVKETEFTESDDDVEILNEFVQENIHNNNGMKRRRAFVDNEPVNKKSKLSKNHKRKHNSRKSKKKKKIISKKIKHKQVINNDIEKNKFKLVKLDSENVEEAEEFYMYLMDDSMGLAHAFSERKCWWRGGDNIPSRKQKILDNEYIGWCVYSETNNKIIGLLFFDQHDYQDNLELCILHEDEWDMMTDAVKSAIKIIFQKYETIQSITINSTLLPISATERKLLQTVGFCKEGNEKYTFDTDDIGPKQIKKNVNFLKQLNAYKRKEFTIDVQSWSLTRNALK